MNEPINISFGDTVRIKTNPLTKSLSLAGKTGVVYGQTAPSVTNVEVIGELKEDYAVNVHFDDLHKSFWFIEDLIEFVDHGAGTEAIIGNTSFVRNKNGEWKVVKKGTGYNFLSKFLFGPFNRKRKK
ncbi:MAG: hypothetical protein DAHOPDDO_01653 [Ignavibacteriaceae bacterium]|nr:hypothetical protein [Ignavibacteriaceae bacterium]